MTFKDILSTIALTCILLGSVQTGRAADDSIDALIVQILDGAKTNSAKASKLLDGALTLTDQPKLCIAVLEKAVEYGLKSPITPNSSQTASQALKLLMTAAPNRKDDWTVLRASTLGAKYYCARGAEAKLEVANELLNALLAAGAVCEKRKQWTLAAAQYRKASPVAVLLKSGSADAIRAKLKTVSYMATIEARAIRYAAALKKTPDKTTTRTMLIKTLVVELNNPAGAVEHMNQDVAETWRTYVPMACKPIEKLTKDECKNLGDWYRKELAKSCSSTAKPLMLSRARNYYQQFLTLHDKNDIMAISVKTAVMSIDKELAKSGSVISSRGSINLLSAINIDKHTISGVWTMKSGVLTSNTRTSTGTYSSPYPKITVPWLPSGSYELTITFAMKDTGELIVMFPVGPDGAVVYCHSTSSSYPMLRTGTTPYRIRGIRGTERLVKGQEYVLNIKVVTKQKDASITVSLDGKTILTWTGDPKQLTPYSTWKLPNPKSLGLGSYRAPIEFKKAILKMTNGRATKLVVKKTPTKTPRR